MDALPIAAEDSILLEIRGKVAIVTLNRPRQINAFNDNVRNGLALIFREKRPPNFTGQ